MSFPGGGWFRFRSFPGIFSWVMAVGSRVVDVVVSEALVFLFQLDAKKETETQKTTESSTNERWTDEFESFEIDSFIFYFVHPGSLGKWSNLTCAYFSNMLKSPPGTKDALDWCPPWNRTARYPKTTPYLKPESSIFKVHHVWGSMLVFEFFLSSCRARQSELT